MHQVDVAGACMPVLTFEQGHSRDKHAVALPYAVKALHTERAIPVPEFLQPRGRHLEAGVRRHLVNEKFPAPDVIAVSLGRKLREPELACQVGEVSL